MLPPCNISSMPYRCCAYVAARGGQVDVTPDIDLDSMKYKGSLIFGSAYICYFFCLNLQLLPYFVRVKTPLVRDMQAPLVFHLFQM